MVNGLLSISQVVEYVTIWNSSQSIDEFCEASGLDESEAKAFSKYCSQEGLNLRPFKLHQVCPSCKSNQTVSDGYSRGRSRRKCKNCGKKYSSSNLQLVAQQFGYDSWKQLQDDVESGQAFIQLFGR